MLPNQWLPMMSTSWKSATIWMDNVGYGDSLKPCRVGKNKSPFVSPLTDLCGASPLWYFLPQTDGLRALQLPAKRWRPQICDCPCYTKWALLYSWFAWFLLTFSMGLKVLTILKVWPLQYLLESANILCRCNFSLVNLSRPYHVLFLSTGSVIKEKENLLYWPLVVETKLERESPKLRLRLFNLNLNRYDLGHKKITWREV